MISINATLFLQILHFLILVFILDRLMFRPIMRVVKDRDKHIQNENEQLNNLKGETEELIARCLSLERNAKREASAESSNIKKEAIEVTERIFSDTRGEVAAIRDEADREIELKLKEARQSLQDEAFILAEDLTEKLIGRRSANQES